VWWLARYVDIRHLSKEHLHKDGQLYREYDLEYDYINQKLLLGPAPPALQELERKLASGQKLSKEEGSQRPLSPAHRELVEASHRPTDQLGKAIMTDPSHPDFLHHGWAPQSNDTWFSKRNELFTHAPRPKRKQRKRGRPDAEALSMLATPTSADGAKGVRFESGANNGNRSPAFKDMTPRSPGGESVASLATNYEGIKEGGEEGEDGSEEDEDSEEESEEEAKSSGDEWVLNGGETRPLLVGREMEAAQSGNGDAKAPKSSVQKRRKRQEGSRWDANGLGIESVFKAEEVRGAELGRRPRVSGPPRVR
jgi:hypothetical protein